MDSDRSFRAVLPEGQIICSHYELVENGVELYDHDEEFLAFVPYANLQALIDDEVHGSDERSIM